ncbi:MAG: VCBS repeat-containing protein, partial [Deltaproteobacteria bacterium]|nr:VCBS repeat-containing protein [Deltaproteobacteria bacterium]
MLFSIPAVGEEVEYIYHWERQFYGSLDGREFLLHNRDLSFAKLAFGDLDGDHNPDLLAGSTDGHISLFMNTGTPDSPRWQLTEEHLRAVKHVKEKGVLRRVMREIELTGHTAPFLVDIDQDQDMDLFVGDQQGRLIFYRNIGTPSLSAFEETSPSLVDKDFGTFLVPTLADVDRDGDEDLVVGTKGGDVFLVINQGDKKKAAFCIRRSPTDQEEVEDGTTVSLAPCRPLPRRIASIAPEKNAAPGLVDWDEDGLPDLFVGQSNGGIYFFPNKGTPTAPLWKASQRKFLSIDEGGYASPVFLDINRDHHPDLLSGSGTNQVFAYTTQGTKSHLDVWEVTPNFLSINRLGGHSSQVVVTTGDLDGDNDPDLILGTKEGRVMLFTNTGTAKKAAWALTNDNLFPEPSRKNAAPLLVDIDQDKDLDLIIGGLNGRLILVLNTGSAKKPRWELETTAFAGVDVGSNSVAAATDLDGDGDLDLFVGNNQGRVVFFQNNGPPANPSFSLVSTHFANTMGAKGAHPAFMDWNEDGRPDLLVGDSQGKLTLYLNQNEKGEPPRRWNPTPTAFGEQWVAGNSAPHLNDLNGDKRPDLLVGDGQGNLLVWLNIGSEKISLNPADPPPPPEDSEPPPPEKDGELLAGEETVPIVTGPIPPAMALVDKNWGG